MKATNGNDFARSTQIVTRTDQRGTFHSERVHKFINVDVSELQH
jgi:hypothetical protein